MLASILRMLRRQSDPFAVQRLFAQDLNRGNISIFDVGANIGNTAAKYRRQFPAANIYCFEPFPSSIARLRSRFRGDAGVHVIQKAVAQDKSVSTFYVNELADTNSLFPRSVSGRRYFPKSAGSKDIIEVETISLDAFISQIDLSRIDILKLDIQGGELNALIGAQELLRGSRISVIYTEAIFVPHYEGAPLFNQVWSYLSGYGYTLFDIFDVHRAKNGQLRYGDALFVSEPTRDGVINRFPEEP